MRLINQMTVLVILFITGCTGTQQMIHDEPPPPVEERSELEILFQNSKPFTKNFTGFVLHSPETDSTYFQLNADKFFTPASNTKLFTFFASLKMLPDSIPALEYQIRGDSLIIWGTGDPTLLHPKFERSPVIDFLKDSSYKIYYSDNHYQDNHLGPGWAWGDYQYSYSTEKSPFPMYGNTVEIEVEEVTQVRISDNEQGELNIYPKLFRNKITDAETRPGKETPLLYREFNDNIIEYMPIKNTDRYSIDRPFHYNPELIVQLLSEEISKDVSYLDEIKPSNTKKLYGLSKDTVLAAMLKPSDNFLAEQLLLAISAEYELPMNSRSAIAAVKERYFQDLPDEAVWVDGSGLSRYNLFTPQTMVELLEQIDREFEDDSTLFSYFPAGGSSGTIRNWYAHREGGDPYVFAKTGTLSNNHCLSGFVITEKGTKLIFSFMNNHYITSSSNVKVEMEKILWHIYKNY
ncbi:MAG: D-alanyl-D-alanine carboxypeptidase [Gracilimonas sp.]|nr:D-alanyl-D-alanine carboxypeptidase [Gracilimonas sp.]